MNELGKLVVFYNSARAGDVYHDVVGELFKHLHELDGLTIYEMAKLCFTAPTTLSRLSKKLGYSNFSDFKSNLVNAVQSYSGINRSMPYTPTKETVETIRLYRKTINEAMDHCDQALNPAYIDKIIEDMGRFESIFFLNNMMFDVTSFQEDVLISGKKTLSAATYEDCMAAVPLLDEKTFVVSSIPRLQESAEMLYVLKAARKASATTLVVTPGILSPYEKYTDYIISYEGTGNSLDRYSLIYVQNILTMVYRARYID